jgi:Lrp/AsnC family transcriptional regulator, leucine-responsive regulatory protein
VRSPSSIELDGTDWAILRVLQDDARTSVRALGDAVGLSPSAAAERRRRLEEAGVLRGYRAEVDPGAAGYSVQAVLRVNIPGAPTTGSTGCCRRRRRSTTASAGRGGLLRPPRPRDVHPHLDAVASRLATTGAVTTNVVYETVVDNRPVEPPG